MAIPLRAANTSLWVAGGLGALGVALGLFPPYRDLLGVVRTPVDLMVRLAPGLATTAFHVWCAVRGGAPGSARPLVVRLCGVFDLVVGAVMWVPWLGPWIGLLSPVSVVFLVLSAHAPVVVTQIAYGLVSLATLGFGAWLLKPSR